jgi:peptide/nickel transport system permease protein
MKLSAPDAPTANVSRAVAAGITQRHLAPPVPSGTTVPLPADHWRRRAAKRRLKAWGRLGRGLLSRPVSAVGLALVVMHLFLAIAGPALAPFPATEFHINDRLQAPSAEYLFGTDQYGRDVFSRVVIGTRGLLLLSFSATILGLALGLVVGMAAGYLGGVVDEVAMRLMDAMMSFPSLLLALLILTMIGPAVQNVVIGIGVVFMPRVARVVRSAVLTQRNLEYVQAARLRGESALYVVTREILPNITGPIVVEGAIRISYAILLGASLGFLGLGVQPPEPDWGLMISEARNFLLVAPWMALAPAGAIATLVVGLNLVADGISHEMDIATGG